MNQESQAILEALLSEGWKEYATCLHPKQRMFAKKFPGHEKCRCNEPKDKQLEIYWHSAIEFDNGNIMAENWSVENVGQLPCNEWLRMSIENLSSRSQIERAVRQLLLGWDHIVKSTPSASEKHS